MLLLNDSQTRVRGPIGKTAKGFRGAARGTSPIEVVFDTSSYWPVSLLVIMFHERESMS